MTAPFAPELQGPSDCGCCEGAAVETPTEVTNRPGLTAIAARVGTHARFKRTMLARLSSSDLPALRRLSTRDDDDQSIALLDAWACVADVLTFYQERIANEGYLRTATERLSLAHLARLIGYEPRPGVAAETYLTFTLENAPGAPPRVTIPAGTRVQSIPGAGERPQTFETSETIEARPAWNGLRPRQTRPQELIPDANRIVFQGTDTGLQRGDPLLIVAPRNDGTVAKVFRMARLVTVDRARERTIVVLNDLPPAHRPFRPHVPLPSPVSSFTPRPLTGDAVAEALLDHIWRDVDLQAFTKVQGWSLDDVFTSLHPRPGTVPRPPAGETGAFALRTRASLFGHNAPDWNTLIKALRDLIDKDSLDWPFTPPERQLDLDAVYPQVQPGSWVIVTRPGATVVARVLSAEETGLSRFALSAKVTRLEIDQDVDITTFVQLRGTTVYAESERLVLAEAPIDEPVEGDSIELERLCAGLTRGQVVVVQGERADLSGIVASEIAVLADVLHDLTAGRTVLVLERRLTFPYSRESVTIFGNVAPATHGETVTEVLGSGDAARPNQQFTLRHSPLTYVSAPVSSGAASTLRVRADGIQWHEVPTLYGRGPDERVFVTRTTDDGRTLVQFGDGRMGARLPTGQENVEAAYRKGIGGEGLVGAGQLSLLMTRPLGVKGVTNPLSAAGAEDRESLADLRRNAPLTVLTLDRVVSLQDYEDFARTYAGIGKALATWFWEGETSGVLLTVAGPGGAHIDPDGTLAANLLAALRGAGDPQVPLWIRPHRPAYFRIAAAVKVHPDHQPDTVLAAVQNSLQERFSFEARALGQPVAVSEVLSVIHEAPGVRGVDVDQFQRVVPTVDPAALSARLSAAGPQRLDDRLLGAELLTLDPGPLDNVRAAP